MTCRGVFAACAALLVLCGFRGGLTTDQPHLPNTPLTVMNLGSGGNISGQSLISGARLVRGDVFGAYVYGADNIWHLINGETNMCPGGYPSATNCNFGYFPANTSANQVYVGFKGITELVGCPNLITCAYMYGGGLVFYSGNVSTAAGEPNTTSWCVTSFTKTADTSNSAIGASPQNPGPMMAVDPNNPAHVLVGTATNGIFESFNATSACSGTDTWTAISTSSIPQGTAYPGYLVAFDQTAPTMTCHIGSGTCTSTAYVSTNGAPSGIYATFDAGTTWTAISSAGSPPNTPLHHIKVSAATAGGGNLWVAPGGSVLYEYNSAAGTPCSTGLGTCSFHTVTAASGGNDVAINPLNGNQIISLGGQGKASVSTNGAAATPTFSATFTSTPTVGDTPWALATVAGTQFFGIGGVDFDPLNNGVLLGHGSQWEYISAFPSGNYTWATLSSGIQGAVSFGNLAVATTQTPTFSYEDVIGCTFSISTAGTPPSLCALPSQGSNGLYEYAGLSVAPGTTTMFSAGQEDTGVGFPLSGYSTDGYRANFLPYNQWNASVVASSANVTSGAASAIRLNVGVTSALNSFAPGQTLNNNSIVCIVTQFATSLLTQNCWPINVIDGSHIDLIGSTFNSGVQVNAGQTYTVYVPANVLSEWFGRGTVSNVVSGSGGLVQVSYLNQVNNTLNHSVICISGVVMTGASVVNGCWVANNSSSNITLQGSIFVPGDTYSTGGTVLSTLIEQSVAASTTSNVAIYGADGTPAYCTTNAGAAWSQVNTAGVPVATTTVTGGPYSSGTTTITIASATGVNFVNKWVVQLHSGRFLDETSSSLSGTTVTLHAAVPPGDSIDNGAGFYGGALLGGPPAAFFRSHQIDVDQVTPNTFYYLNAAAGLVKWTNCGSTTVVATPGSPSFLSQSGFGDQLKSVPGQAGHLFYTAGPVGAAGANHPAGNTLWRTCNGVNNTAGSVTMSQVPGFFEPLAVGLGSVAPGHTYPSIYVVGWYSPTNTRNTSTYGIWLSTDDANNGSTGACATGNTWTSISDGFPAGFPNGSILDIAGDRSLYGPYYVFGTFGQFYGVQN